MSCILRDGVPVYFAVAHTFPCSQKHDVWRLQIRLCPKTRIDTACIIFYMCITKRKWNLTTCTDGHRHTRGHSCIYFFTALWIYFHRSPPIRCFPIAIMKILTLNITDFVPESIQYVFHGNRFTIQQHDHPVSRRGGQTSV